QRLHPQQWLLIEWPSAQDEPTRYWLSTLVEDTPLPELVRIAHLRWRIERDYQDLKQDLGLGHYEGRGWRGFHHHASLSIAAYGFLLGQRLRREALSGPDGQGKKTSWPARYLRFPRITAPAVGQRAQRHVAESITTLRHQLGVYLMLEYCRDLYGGLGYPRL
ncbi:Transposase DDE domain-containing protein, partial [Azotobacter vinelandii]